MIARVFVCYREVHFLFSGAALCGILKCENQKMEGVKYK